MLTQFSQSAARQDDQQDDQQLRQKAQEFLDQMIAERHVTVSAEAREKSIHLMMVAMQQVLLSDAKVQFDVKKREKLGKKWAAMDDSPERRLIFSLLFADFKTLSTVDQSLLSDNLEQYQHKRDGAERNQYWMRDLNLAALLGSRTLGEFIVNAQESLLKNEDYNRILGYISGSFNDDWAISFAKVMKDKGMSMPNSVEFFCDDFSLAESIEASFLGNRPSMPGK